MAQTSIDSAEPKVELSVSRYDQVSGLLLAVLVVLGVLTSLMFLVWLSTRMAWKRPPPAVQVLQDVGGGGKGSSLSPGDQQDFEEPLLEEMQLEQPPVESSLELISAIVAETPELSLLDDSGGQGNGEGTGMGDGRGIGPGGPGTSDGVPAWERWEIRMSATDLAAYARQLDFFGVELGVAGGGDPNVSYISKLSDPKPTVRIGDPRQETRLRFLHRSGKLRDADRQLAAKAGVDPQGKVVFQFYTPATYQTLLALENSRMGSRRIAEVRKTVFGVREADGRYEFFVISQHYSDGTSS